MTADLSELLAKIEAANGADRALDVALSDALNDGFLPFNQDPYSWLCKIGTGWIEVRRLQGIKEGFHSSADRYVARYTGSIDEALALVGRKLPEHDWAYSLVFDYGGLRRCHINIAAGTDGWPPGGANFNEDAETVPLAILAALLRALAETPAND